MRVFFKSNQNVLDSVDVYSPNGNTVTTTVTATSNNGSGTIILWSRVSTISGTSITRARSSAADIRGVNSTGMNTSSNEINIVRVEAWNE